MTKKGGESNGESGRQFSQLEKERMVFIITKKISRQLIREKSVQNMQSLLYNKTL